MFLQYEGIPIDTDKGIYICGYTITHDWFEHRTNHNGFNNSKYPISCKKFYIRNINFKCQENNGVVTNTIKSINAHKSNRQSDEIVLDIAKCGWGRTPKEAKDMWFKKRNVSGNCYILPET